MNKKELYNLWKKYIDIPIYRIVSGWHYNEVLKNGINPKRDPYEEIKPDLIKFFKLVIELEERRGYMMRFNFRNRGSVGSYWAKVSISDLKMPVVDFTTDTRDIEYYKNAEGGAVAANTRRLTSKILEDKPNLSKSEWKLVKKLNNWAEKMKIKGRVIVVRGSGDFFESALFQLRGLSKTKVRRRHKDIYYSSPFGRFEHFVKVIEAEGLRKYSYRLRHNRYYLRVRAFVPPSEIKPYVQK